MAPTTPTTTRRAATTLIHTMTLDLASVSGDRASASVSALDHGPTGKAAADKPNGPAQRGAVCRFFDAQRRRKSAVAGLRTMLPISDEPESIMALCCRSRANPG